MQAIKKYGVKGILVSLFALVVICVVSAGPVLAQNKKGDTVSTSDVQFTTIQSGADKAAAKADSITKAVKKQTDSIAKAKASASGKNIAPGTTNKQETLWSIFIAGFLGGLLAITMPCIYPLLPLTVGFFTKKSGSRARGIWHSLLYGLSIIGIYVVLGLIITIIFGPSALNSLATNGVFNIFFFLLLVVFAASFFGAFEINLPSSLANKLDANSEKGGVIGIFFMAATLAVVSFSCTGPIIGTLLVDATSKGERLAPAMGMFGFSSALALPFTLFALFPSALKSLPKSGGWLNSVKVMLGFLELALSLKFLLNVDLAYHWKLLSRDFFLAIWIAIAILAVLYLIGKIKFSHDSDLPYVSVPRIFLAVIIFAFGIYMVPGLWGAPLKPLSGLLPPPATQDFDLSNITAPAPAPTAKLTTVKEKKYEALFADGKHKWLDEWYDYDQALAVSKELKKPILIDFTGWNCANCRTMEQQVWSDARVKKLMQQEFVLLELYVDEKKDLPANEVYTSKFSGREITTIGGRNSDREASNYGANSQPYYVIINSDGNVLVPPQGANYSVDNYINFLNSGISAYKK